jgi:hypothetical protein
MYAEWNQSLADYNKAHSKPERLSLREFILDIVLNPEYCISGYHSGSSVLTEYQERILTPAEFQNERNEDLQRELRRKQLEEENEKDKQNLLPPNTTPTLQANLAG